MQARGGTGGSVPGPDARAFAEESPDGAARPRWISWLAWAGLAVLALLPRVLFLRAWPENFDADEALVGVHVREILAGRFSLFLPGQSYMGSLQSLVGAVCVGLFGSTATAVRLAPLLWVLPGLRVLRAWQRRGEPAGSAWILAALWLLPPAVLFHAGTRCAAATSSRSCSASAPSCCCFRRAGRARRPERR